MQTSIAVIIAFFTALFLTPLTIKLAKKIGAVDMPNGRKVHTDPMPRIGGLAIFFAFIIGVLVFQGLSSPALALIISGALIMGVGFYDDIRGVAPQIKLIVQLAAALLLIQNDIYIRFISNPFIEGSIISLGVFAIPITLIWLIGISNAINLMDGLDGLSVGISAIAAVTIAIVSYSQNQLFVFSLSLILAASALGFLRYNFHPAKTFMGDCGSLFLGFMLGVLSLMGPTKSVITVSLFVPLIILGVPIFDTFFAIVRRMFLKKPIFQADKGHLHHCLLAMGLSHTQVVLLLYAVSIIMGAIAVIMTTISASQSVLLFVLTLLIIVACAARIGLLRGRKCSNLEKQEIK